MSGDIRKRWGEANIRMEAAHLGCLGGCSGRLLLQHPPPGLSGDGAWARSRSRSGVGVVGTAGLHLVDESFYGGKLLGQVAQVSFEGVELLVEVVESLRQRLDPEQEHRGGLGFNRILSLFRRTVYSSSELLFLWWNERVWCWEFPQEFGFSFGLKIKSSLKKLKLQFWSQNSNVLLCSSFSTWKSGVSCLSPQCRGPDVIMVRWLRKLDRSTFRTYSALLSHSRSAFVLFWYISKSKIQSSDAVWLILRSIKGGTDGRDHDVCGKSLLFQSDTKTSCYTLNFLFSLCSLT